MLGHPDSELRHGDAGARVGRRDVQRRPNLLVVVEAGAVAGAAVAQVAGRDDEPGAGETDVAHPARPHLVERVAHVARRALQVGSAERAPAVGAVGADVGPVGRGEDGDPGLDRAGRAERLDDRGRGRVLREGHLPADVVGGALVEGVLDPTALVPLQPAQHRRAAPLQLLPAGQGDQVPVSDLGQSGVVVHGGEQRAGADLGIPRGHQVNPAQRGGHLRGFQQGPLGVRAEQLVEAGLQGGVGDGHPRGLAHQETGGATGDVGRHRNVQARLAPVGGRRAVAPPQSAPAVAPTGLPLVDRGETLRVAGVPRVVDRDLGELGRPTAGRPRRVNFREWHRRSPPPPVDRGPGGATRRRSSARRTAARRSCDR